MFKDSLELLLFQTVIRLLKKVDLLRRERVVLSPMMMTLWRFDESELDDQEIEGDVYARITPQDEGYSTLR